MNDKIQIKEGKLNIREVLTAYNSTLFLGNIDDLIEYNTMNYFIIMKFYVSHFFSGYAVLFIGYNSLLTTDCSLEDITWWGLKSEDLHNCLKILFLDKFNKSINIYYNPHDYSELIRDELKSYGLKRKRGL